MTREPYYKLPDTLLADIETYAGEVARFQGGQMEAAHLKGRRVPRGVYEQRRDGTFMVRTRVAGGALGAAQAATLAAASREFGNGLLHVTTRQDIQFHDVSIGDTPKVMRRLLGAGLTSRGGGGNTVRNVTACHYAGVCPAERFDVTPCALAVTEYLIALPGSYNLPRKYKIAFSGCPADCALAQAFDLGFVAAMRDGVPGFRVLAGGGMGAWSRIADTLLEWAPASDAIRIAETVRRLFDELGDRSNKHRARLRFAVERIGREEFARLFRERFVQVVAEGVPEWRGPAEINQSPAPLPAPPALEERYGLRVAQQRQPGLCSVFLHAPLGFIPANDFETLGRLAERFSAERGLRATVGQNLLLRGVAQGDLSALHGELRRLETDMLTPQTLERFTACAGAATCRLGICLGRQAARACADALDASGLDCAARHALSFHINGCSNACGQQPIAAIGFFGMAMRAHGRLVPAYTLTMGGGCGAGGARLGETIGKLPAAAMPVFLVRLAADFDAHRQAGEDFNSYYARQGKAHFQTLLEPHAAIPSPEEAPGYYRDFGSDEPFSLAGRGAGECGSGVFEVIEHDLAAAQKAAAPFEKLVSTCRALLITRGSDDSEPGAVLRAFERHFIDTGLVAVGFRNLLDRGRGHMQGWQSALDGLDGEISALLERVTLLYKSLDANLKFRLAEPLAEAPSSQPAKPACQLMTSADVTRMAHELARESPDSTVAAAPPLPALDLRGVGCPINFVKVKLRLEMLESGDELEVTLDDGDPIANVPASLRAEGHTVDQITNLHNGHWRLRVRKG